MGKDMSSVAAVVNPLNTKEVLLFFATGASKTNSHTNNVAMEHRGLASTSDDTLFEDNNVRDGPLAQPGDFAAVVHNNTVVVYGIVSFVDGDNKNASVVSQISPVVNPISAVEWVQGGPATGAGICTGYSALGACSNGASNDYVVFLQGDPSKGSPQIVEFELSADGTPSSTILERAAPRIESQLASVYLPHSFNRFHFYQDSKNYINYVRYDTGGNNSLKGTSDSLLGAPITAVAIPLQEGGVSWTDIVLFYQNNANWLHKVVYKQRTDTWSSPEQVNSQVEPGSGLSAVLGENKVYIFFYSKGSTKITKQTVAV